MHGLLGTLAFFQMLSLVVNVGIAYNPTPKVKTADDRRQEAVIGILLAALWLCAIVRVW
jgi:hypothetical protein